MVACGELKVLGFVEEQNLKIVVGGFGLREDQFADVAATLAKAAPDVVFCVIDVAIRAARQSADTGPLVALSGDLVAAGFVRSLAHSGGNFTGIQHIPEPNSIANGLKSSWKPYPMSGVSRFWRTRS